VIVLTEVVLGKIKVGRPRKVSFSILTGTSGSGPVVTKRRIVKSHVRDVIKESVPRSFIFG
jgi:hypothetical protein